MSIDSTYRKILLEQFINDAIKSGEIVSAEDISAQVQTLINTLDLTQPQFLADTYKVEEGKSSSASSFTESQKVILQDLSALYQEMLNLTDVSTNAYERWRLEAEILEKDVANLEDRIANLLLLEQDTEGYHSYLVDNFDNFQLTDRTLTTAIVDPVGSLLKMGPTNTVDTRIYLNHIDQLNQVSFKVRSTASFVSRSDGNNTQLSDIFKQQSNSWFTFITMKKAAPVTCELVVKLDDSPIKLTRIQISLNQIGASSSMTITPLYSTDNFTFKQLPTNTYTQDVRDIATFSFSEIEATYIKFLLTKVGHDPVPDNADLVSYQFGFKEIAFYAEGFDATTSEQFFSSVLSVPNASDPTQKVEFSKLTLDACERVEANTSINYFVTASNDSTLPVTDSTIWVPVTPIGRAVGNNSKVVNLGDIESIEYGLNEIVNISFANMPSTGEVSNPDTSFHLLSLSTIGTIFDELISTIDTRYIFTNNNERILNYQVKDSDYSGSGSGSGLTIDEDNITIFRNSGSKTLDPTNINSLVRGVQKGWKFEEPYYSTVIEIQNPLGMTINFGDKIVVIDDQNYSNIVGPNILTGRTKTTLGIHKIKVHKDNWLAITPSLTSLDDIQSEDKLYPYNHKLLIEGYDYTSNYTGTETKVYIGVDVFASELMKKVSIFDLVGSVNADQYQFFALDRDAPNTHTGTNEATRVFVVKVDENQSDLTNEQFVIRFNLINQRYKYLRLRADLSTQDEKVTPSLDSYKIKLG